MNAVPLVGGIGTSRNRTIGVPGILFPNYGRNAARLEGLTNNMADVSRRAIAVLGTGACVVRDAPGGAVVAVVSARPLGAGAR